MWLSAGFPGTFVLKSVHHWVGGGGALGLHEWWLGGRVCIQDALEAPPEGLLCATLTWGPCGAAACSWVVGSWRRLFALKHWRLAGVLGLLACDFPYQLGSNLLQATLRVLFPETPECLTSQMS